MVEAADEWRPLEQCLMLTLSTLHRESWVKNPVQVHQLSCPSYHPCSLLSSSGKDLREPLVINGDHKTHLLLLCSYIFSEKECWKTVGVWGFVKVGISDFNVNKLWKCLQLK